MCAVHGHMDRRQWMDENKCGHIGMRVCVCVSKQGVKRKGGLV